MALPVFLRRVKSMLHEYRSGKAADRLQLDNCLCCLDMLTAMTLAPAVTDSVLPPGSRLKVALDVNLLIDIDGLQQHPGLPDASP